MMRFAIILTVLAMTVPATAEDLARVTRPCATEQLVQALQSCLAALVDQRDAAMSGRIEQTLSGLQAASGPELRALEASYAAAQSEWRKAVRRICLRKNPDDFVSREISRASVTESFIRKACSME